MAKKLRHDGHDELAFSFLLVKIICVKWTWMPCPYWEAAMRQLRGLRQAGAVVSILWFVGFGTYFWIHRHGEARRIQEAAWNDCNIKYDSIIDALIPSPNGQQRNAIEAERSECRKAVTAEYSNHRKAAIWELTSIAAIDACTVVLAWLIAWMFLELIV